MQNPATSQNESLSEGHEIDRLYRTHRIELLRFLTGVLKDANLAEDVLQTTFTKAIETKSAEPTKAWLFKIGMNAAIDRRRRQRTEDAALANLSNVFAIEHPVDTVSDDEQTARVRAALNELPDEQFAVVRMRIYEDMTFAQIAEKLDTPLGTVLTRMRLALGKLRGRLQMD